MLSDSWNKCFRKILHKYEVGDLPFDAFGTAWQLFLSLQNYDFVPFICNVRHNNFFITTTKRGKYLVLYYKNDELYIGCSYKKSNPLTLYEIDVLLSKY